MSKDLMIPRVHLNGTSAEELVRQLADARDALRQALEAMARATPHGRDYYVINGEAIAIAQDHHRERVAKIVTVMDELEQVAQGILAQSWRR